MRLRGPRLALVLPFLLLLLGGCAAARMEDALRSKASGTAVQYPVSRETAWSIARNIVFVAAHFNVESSRDRSVIACEAGTGTDTTFIVVWIDPGAGPGETVVTIRSIKEGVAQITSVLTESEFHEKFAERVKGLDTGGS